MNYPAASYGVSSGNILTPQETGNETLVRLWWIQQKRSLFIDKFEILK
jgi:hypothetical protein